MLVLLPMPQFCRPPPPFCGREMSPIYPRCARYSPELSRRCTHLVAPAQLFSSRKLQLVFNNRGKWPTLAVTSAWLSECAAMGTRLAEAAFAVDLEAVYGQPQPRQACQDDASAVSEAAGRQGSAHQPLASLEPPQASANTSPKACPSGAARSPLGVRRSKVSRIAC